jgi:acetyl-CoA carboxylase biotin carboxyl carrier protein
MAKTPKQPAAQRGAPGRGFSFEDVKLLVRLVEESAVTHIAWQRGSEKVVIRRGGESSAFPAAVHAVPVTAAVPPHGASYAALAAAREPKPDAPGVVVSSPFVGTFYRSPSPDAPSFVDLGQKVKKGQTLCIIEAMKLMNEIEAECAGIVTEIFAQNGKSVEYGQRLFRIKLA